MSLTLKKRREINLGSYRDAKYEVSQSKFNIRLVLTLVPFALIGLSGRT